VLGLAFALVVSLLIFLLFGVVGESVVVASTLAPALIRRAK
jgi:hypothetical protein